MTNEEVLQLKVDNNTTVIDATAVQFIQWVLRKVNDANLTSNSSAVSELNMLASGYPGRVMPVENKIEIIEKMKRVGITF